MDLKNRVDQLREKQAEIDRLYITTGKCEKHDIEYRLDTRNSEIQCPQCKAEIEAYKQANILKNRKRDSIVASGLPVRFIEKTFDQYQANTSLQSEIVYMVREYALNSDALSLGRCLMLFGGVGTGKTHLAASVIGEVVNGGKTKPVYTTARDMIRSIRAAWGNRQLDEMEIINRYALADILVIDEIGVQFGSEAELILMFEIIDKRYGSRLPTVFISNLSLVEIKQILGDRIIDRIKEDDGLVIEMRWDSKRGKM